MKASETILANLMQGRAQQFQIPLYQRTYTWQDRQKPRGEERNHLLQIWADILEQARMLKEGREGTAHFLGSIVLAPSPDHEATFPRHIVVDGQQRLTTLSLALAAIRDHVEARDADAAERINEDYLINKREKGDDFFRLLPTQADRAAYAACIRSGHSAGDDRVSRAYRFFRGRLEAVEAPADPADRQEIALIEQAITTRLNLVSVTADPEDNVHRIFESLNNTGERLSQADLLRNDLFMRLPGRADRVYEAYWLPMQELLPETSDLEHLMWLQLVLDGDDGVRRQDLYTAQRERFNRGGGGEDEIETYLRELHRRAFHLKAVLEPDREPDSGVRACLKRLEEWDTRPAHCVVMLLLDLREKGELDSHGVVQGLSYLESFLVRRLICGVRTSNLGRILQSVPVKMPVGVAPVEGLRRVLSSDQRLWPDDDQLRDHIRHTPFYVKGGHGGSLRQFVLRRLEEAHGHPEPVDFTKAALTMEHVMPQTAGAEWLEVLAEECEADETSGELHARLLHTLGNLTLTAVNSTLSNHPFERKQELLRASGLEMNRRIAAADRWGAAEILARADELALLAVKVWPGPAESGGRVQRGRDWGQLHQALAVMKEGTWTTYGALAALIGSSAQAVGTHLLNTPGVPNPHRVLTVEGRVADGFRWADGRTTEDALELLRAEGVAFSFTGVADPGQRLSAADLARLLDVDGTED
ncbi:DUF262 domain-containing protein [Streptomyces apocyni]|uniref:DUF262 domain-containing protein n=1 Tax=Streptomyces apocyni TaxID=2654677 RepID=UPI0012E9C464|nr:DUF262 domain-containing protein [Streptomyces apocyni]